MPWVLRPGKVCGLTDIADSPVPDKFPGCSIPEKIKSSGITSTRFSHGIIPDLVVWVTFDVVSGMQNS